VQVPDPHRLCEAIITSSGSGVNAVSRSGSAGAITTQTGRAIISIGAGGSGSVNITFSPAFAAAPTLTVSSDNQYGIVIGGLTTTGATITVTGATPNTFVWISYQAQGH
jgi:hypothetical protein